jgi:hypothetical protein
LRNHLQDDQVQSCASASAIHALSWRKNSWQDLAGYRVFLPLVLK